MRAAQQNRFSDIVTVFHDRRLAEPARPAGYAALIDAFDLEAPLPHTLHGIGLRHKTIDADGWRLLTPRHAPDATLAAHLRFALRWEGLDLTVLKRLFLATGPDPIVALVRAQPTGAYARRLWFLYEWLTGSRLDLPDASAGRYVDVVDERLQYGGRRATSSRHRVRDNLPGTRSFCPLVRRSEALEELRSRDLAAVARDVVGRIPRDVIARAAGFLLLADSRSSFAIEGEQPAADRIQRWGQVIGQAGRRPLDLEELLRLQRLLIGDARFVPLGLREAGGFVGQHDRVTGQPLPDHVSARPQDLPELIEGLLAFDADATLELDPVVAAACLAFGFVYIHPFVDGNGRLHRYLVHHVLAARHFNPGELVFPVSAVMLREIDTYRRVLETHSKPVLGLVEWEPSQDGNILVQNDTADFYRFFDATPHAEFLYRCVAETIDHDLPEEVDYLQRHDRFKARVQEIVEMPAATLDLLSRFLRQNEGRLSARAREGEFAALTAPEVARIERAWANEFAQE